MFTVPDDRKQHEDWTDSLRLSLFLKVCTLCQLNLCYKVVKNISNAEQFKTNLREIVILKTFLILNLNWKTFNMLHMT